MTTTAQKQDDRPEKIQNRRNTAIRLENVSKTFSEGGHSRTVIDRVSAAFGDREFVALIGKSGSGKSTLLNLISGIDKPESGDIFIGETCITAVSERERTLFRRDHIGFVFQFFHLIPVLTVLENVTMPMELAGSSARASRNAAMSLLEKVGMDDRKDSFPDRLSGGEQQRVAIARALAHDPALILADEPTGNLDEETGRSVFQLLLGLTRDAGKSLVAATHNLDMADAADRVFRIQDGRLIETPKSAAGAKESA
ncbi:MAG: ABC transporter ATP-binding protein [Desulfobacteraceae bacterium]|nr:MAG: ABC transporter ATP-binding protein [Desulfobacteraceae bacterium]